MPTQHSRLDRRRGAEAKEGLFGRRVARAAGAAARLHRLAQGGRHRRHRRRRLAAARGDRPRPVPGVLAPARRAQLDGLLGDRARQAADHGRRDEAAAAAADVRVLSSSAFRLGWRGNAGHRRPDLRWQLELKRGGGGKNGVSAVNGTRAAADAGAWSVVASRIAGESFDAVGLACERCRLPELRAQGVEGVALVSAPSEPLATTRLPALPTAGGSTKQGAAAGGMRLRITAHLANGTALPTASFIEGKLAAPTSTCRRCGLEKFAQREPAAVIVARDLYSTSARPAAASAARLAGLVVRRSPLLAHAATAEATDAAAGLEQLAPDGAVRCDPQRRTARRPPCRAGVRAGGGDVS